MNCNRCFLLSVNCDSYNNVPHYYITTHRDNHQQTINCTVWPRQFTNNADGIHGRCLLSNITCHMRILLHHNSSMWILSVTYYNLLTCVLCNPIYMKRITYRTFAGYETIKHNDSFTHDYKNPISYTFVKLIFHTS